MAILAALFAAEPARAAPPVPVPVSVLDRAIARGAVLEAEDFASEDRSPAQARGALVAADAAGREATRNLAAGSIVRASDLVAPRLVRRGEPVNVVVHAGGLVIATPGKALGGGGVGDLVRVVVAATNRTLDGVVVAAGEVRVAAR